MTEVVKYIILILLISLGLTSKSFSQTMGDTTVYKVVEEMPMFIKCDIKENDYKSLKLCADQKFLSYFRNSFKFPPLTESEKMECCHSIISFIVEKDGNISNIEILKSEGKKIDAKLINFFKEMEPWIPGKLRKENVRVKVHFPIRIHLK